MRLFFTLMTIMILGLLTAQNSCETAQEIIAFGTYTVTQVDGEPEETTCTIGANSQTAAEWFSFTANTDTTIAISTDLVQNSGDDTRISIFRGDCNNLVCYEGNDDVSATNYLSYVNFEVIAGTTYYIVFDNRWSNTGFDFLIEEIEPTETLISFTAVFIGSTLQSVRGVADLNGDFLDDAYSFYTDYSIKVFQQTQQATFEELIFETSYIENPPSWSTVVGDYNNDGYNDILFGSGSGVTLLKAINQQTSYEVINYPQYVFSQRSNFVDIENDGLLDAFVCHDIEPNVYFLNEGGWLNFNQGGLGDTAEGGNYGSIWTDYDNDGDIDLFIAKCRGGDNITSLDQLYQNDGQGNYSNVASTANLEDAIQTWSSAWGDFDNDGDMDVLVGAFSFANGGHKLMQNNGDGTFSNITSGSGWDQITTGGREFVTFDFDNDGYLDIFTSANGGDIIRNNGDLTFTPLHLAIPFGPVGDLNNDGFLDILSANFFQLNDGNENHWLTLNTVGTLSNRNGIGARIEVHGPWGTKIREVRSGEGFSQMHTLNTHIGLGEATEIYSIIIKWPSGTVDTYTSNLNVDTVITVTEGETLGTEEVSQGEDLIAIYPNPAQDFLYLQNIKGFQSYTIFNVNGRMIQSGKEREIPISHLEKGIYLISIDLGKSSNIVRKFSKN